MSPKGMQHICDNLQMKHQNVHCSFSSQTMTRTKWTSKSNNVTACMETKVQSSSLHMQSCSTGTDTKDFFVVLFPFSRTTTGHFNITH